MIDFHRRTSTDLPRIQPWIHESPKSRTETVAQEKIMKKNGRRCKRGTTSNGFSVKRFSWVSLARQLKLGAGFTLKGQKYKGEPQLNTKG